MPHPPKGPESNLSTPRFDRSSIPTTVLRYANKIFSNWRVSILQSTTWLIHLTQPAIGLWNR